jgi:alpha-1,2-glucosyltransferase
LGISDRVESLSSVILFSFFILYRYRIGIFGSIIILASRKKLYQIAAISSFIAITFRQTNIVWMMLIMGLSIVDLLKNKQSNPNFKDFILFVMNDYVLLIKKLWGFLLNGVLFGLFLVWNKGIVIGDKSNHVAAFHVPQIYYFAVFLVFFSWDYQIIVDGSIILKRPIQSLVIGLIMGWTILNYT